MTQRVNEEDGKGVVGKAFWLVITFLVIIGVVMLSLYSFQNTVEFVSLAATDGLAWSIVASIIIQFSPNLLLYLLRHEENGNMKIAYWAGFWLLTVVDMGTNVGKGIEQGAPIQATVPAAIILAKGLRFLFDVVIVFAEELVEKALSAFFNQVADLIDALGGDAPNALRMIDSLNDGPRNRKQAQRNQQAAPVRQQDTRQQGRDTHRETDLESMLRDEQRRNRH